MTTTNVLISEADKAPDYRTDPTYVPRGAALDWDWAGDHTEAILLALDLRTRDAIANRHGLEVLQAHYRKAAERLAGRGES